MLKDRKALALFELLIVFCVIFLLTGVFAIYTDRALKAGREQALENELINIRMAIQHYRIITGNVPKKLTDLINKRLTSGKFEAKIQKRKFLEHERVDKEGYLQDPFMHRYWYDNKKGIIYSQTEGYERW